MESLQPNPGASLPQGHAHTKFIDDKNTASEFPLLESLARGIHG